MEIPPGITALGPDVERRLEALVREAQRRQADQLRAALQQTLDTVPGPLRGVVRKVVGG